MEELAPGLSSGMKRLVEGLDPKACEIRLLKMIHTKQQSAFEGLVADARHYIGKDPVHVSDKIIFHPWDKHYSSNQKLDRIKRLGIFLNVCINGVNPVSSGDPFFDHITLESVSNKTAYDERNIPHPDILKTKFFRNGKIKMWMLTYTKLEFIGALVRGELKDQEFHLDDGTTLICP
jgi:hypothetical protein